MAISFRQIRYFIAVADAGKISTAAENLNVSQSAVSTAIKYLEEELDAPLFQRKSGGVVLTYEGYQFVGRAQNILAAVSEATRGLRRSGDTLHGTLRIGVTYTVAGYFIPQILMRFNRSFPEINVCLEERERRDIEEMIIQGKLDIAVILVSNLENIDQLTSQVLLQSRRRLWLCADHHLLQEEHIGFAEIAEEPYIMLTIDEAEQSALRYWKATSYSPNTIFRTISVEAVRSMVATGMGVTILSDMVFRPWSLEGQHVEVKTVDGVIHTMDVGLVWKKDKEMAATTKAFYEYLCFTFAGYEVNCPSTPTYRL